MPFALPSDPRAGQHCPYSISFVTQAICRAAPYLRRGRGHGVRPAGPRSADLREEIGGLHEVPPLGSLPAYAELTDDALGAAGALRTQPGVDPAKVGV